MEQVNMSSMENIEQAIELPSNVADRPWIYWSLPEIETTYPNADGKWMMFFDKKVLDEKWLQACRLYSEGRLRGINSMKVSTGFKNPRATNGEKVGIIIFYCGPADLEDWVLEYGWILKTQMEYKGSKKQHYFYYKSDAQTNNGTIATGSKENSSYKIDLLD